MKTCRTCGRDKEETDFPLRESGLRRQNCKKCDAPNARKSSRKWKLNNPHHAIKAAAVRRFRAYGITQEEFEKLLKSQSGKCEICSVVLIESHKNFAPCVDHDHDSGVIRGLLCKRCNVGLGNFGESAERLLSAIKYLKKHS